MDTEQLRTFLEISRTRHFGVAAKNLFLSQSAVSSRIQALENLVGASLFVRERNNLQLTPAGHRLLNHAEDILSAWNRVRQGIAIETGEGISLAIAGTPSLWDILLQDWVHQLRREMEEAAVYAEVCDAEVIFRRLLEGTIDVGFTFEGTQNPKLVSEKIADIPLVLVCTNPSLALDEVFDHNYVLVDWGISFAIDHGRLFPDINPPMTRLPLGRIALAYLLECGGAAYLAEPTVEEAISDGRLHTVTGAPVITRPAFAIYSARSERRDFIKTVLKLY